MGSMMEKKSYRKALLMPRPRRLVPPRWMITILFCIIFPVFFGVFFSAIEHGERSCCTSPNSKNDALSCLAEPKNAVFYDSAVGPVVLVLLYHCAADAQAIVFFFLLKVFPSKCNSKGSLAVSDLILHGCDDVDCEAIPYILNTRIISTDCQ